MFKYFLNKRISTPIATGIILVLALVVGGYTYWQYSEIQKEESRMLHVKISEKEKIVNNGIEQAEEKKLDKEKKWKNLQKIKLLTGRYIEIGIMELR